MKTENLQLGIDIGSTTAKSVVTRDGEIIYTSYERHNTKIKESILAILETIKKKFPEDKKIKKALLKEKRFKYSTAQFMYFFYFVK